MTSLSGVGPALVTPFQADFSIDYAGLGKLIDFVIENGVDYVVTLGTTGETATLSKQEKREVLDYTFKRVAGRVPVVVGLGGNDTAEVIECLQTWPIEHAAAVLSVSPYYNKPSQEGIYRHYAAIAMATTKPVILYNVPGRTGSNITPATTFRLANHFSNIIGTKEASGNMEQCLRLCKERPDGFYLISGDDHISLPLIACGFNGVISVAANCFPAGYSRLVHESLAGNFQRANQIQHTLLDGIDLLFAENNPAGVKAFLAEMGIIENVLRLPLVPISAHWHQKIKDFVASMQD
jgi:4-hydroxy-tetrahydrodipicolinate synthase